MAWHKATLCATTGVRAGGKCGGEHGTFALFFELHRYFTLFGVGWCSVHSKPGPWTSV